MFIRIVATILGMIAFGIVGYVFFLNSTNAAQLLLGAIALLLMAVAMLLGHATYLLEQINKQ